MRSLARWISALDDLKIPSIVHPPRPRCNFIAPVRAPIEPPLRAALDRCLLDEMEFEGPKAWARSPDPFPSWATGLDERKTTGTCGRVVATDFSPEMVAHAKSNLGVLGAADIVRCEVRDGQALGFEDASFDAVFSAFGIFLFPDRNARRA
ncbi:class I SAM-dependent methyltransferase [Sorangium sp. So ce854]|uniref:class I SAM-dependent methyltransferase n=1 Tax=Sorangium sp. So ce854 TaxID=3133322 RepID=UPI003F5E5863